MEDQELEQVTVKSVAMKWGLILGVVLIGYSLIIQMAGLIGDSAASWVSYIFIVGAIYMAQKAFKQEGDSFMSYGKGLGLGMLLLLISSVISSGFMYINMKFIDTTIIDTIKELQYEQMVEKGMPEEQIDKALEMSASFMTPEFITIMAIVGTLFIGFILTLIITAITKNANPSDEV